MTIVEKGPHLLGPMDEEVSEALKEQLVKKGITVYCNAMVEEIQREEGLVCTVRHLLTDCLLYTSSYEEVNGPLQVADADFNNWNWINGPWPWEGGIR